MSVDRDTAYLMPPSVQEWLPQNHLARLVVEIMERLDLGSITMMLVDERQVRSSDQYPEAYFTPHIARVSGARRHVDFRRRFRPRMTGHGTRIGGHLKTRLPLRGNEVGREDDGDENDAREETLSGSSP